MICLAFALCVCVYVYRDGTQMTQMRQIYTDFIFSLCICGHLVKSVSSVCQLNSHFIA